MQRRNFNVELYSANNSDLSNGLEKLYVKFGLTVEKPGKNRERLGPEKEMCHFIFLSLGFGKTSLPMDLLIVIEQLTLACKKSQKVLLANLLVGPILCCQGLRHSQTY